MPLASVFAVVAGFVMILWRRLVEVVTLIVDKLAGRLERR